MHGGRLLLNVLLLSVPLATLTACSAITSALIKEFAGKKKPADATPEIVQVTPAPDNTGSVLVNGPQLTGILLNPDGTPVADAGITVVETNIAATTNSSGEFALPVLGIPAANFEMRLSFERTDADSGESFLFDRVVAITLPPDLAVLVQATKDDPTATNVIEPRLALMLPRAPIGQPTAGGQDDKYLMSSVSLPIAANGKSFAVLPHIRGLTGIAKYEDVSIGSSVRFEWDAPEWAIVMIGYGKNSADIAAWKGEQPSAQVEVISRYEDCSEETFRNVTAGPLDPILGKCGLTFSNDANAKLNMNDDYYFRVAVVSADLVWLSPLEKAKHSASRWYQYHSEVESCTLDYFGPSLMDETGTTVDTAKFGPTLPACDAGRVGQAFCTGSDSISPSKCTSCETNLFVCK
ncbi:MAG: hypothetical protein RLZZ488_2832 [Pseudomonadota bacterium]|jgi:hypothetical protein